MSNENNQVPAADPNAAPAVDPKPNEEASPSSTEKKDEDKTAEELAAEAEAIEAELKNKVKQTPEQIRENQFKRLQKAREKQSLLNNEPEDKKSEIAVEDLVTLEVQGIEKNSDKAKLLKRYVDAGLVSNYKEALNHVGVKAELEALNASSNAKTVVDENDTAENQLKTKKEVIASYRASGEVPEDPELRKALAEDNLSKMSSLN
jgi:hypothetical protein